jgi:hypothetical protein
VTLSSTTTARPTFTATIGQCTVTFQLTVSDGAASNTAQVVVSVFDDATGLAVNLAPTATVTASSDTPAYGQTAAKAVDGIVDGYPGNYAKEWATFGGGAGSWLSLQWAAPVTLSRVVLHDRPNAADQILAATLQLSDGSTMTVDTLPNDGSPLTVLIPSIATTSVLLTITSTSGTTLNIGLSEIEAWGTPTTTGAPPPVVAVDGGAPDAGGGAPSPPPPPSEVNLAATAAVTASSETPAYGQTATKAVDGIVDGYPGDYTKEWATNGGHAGSSLALSWSSTMTLSRIVLYDRPNLNDQITSATLQFSDGSEIDIGALPNDGSPMTITLPSICTKSILMTITGVNSRTENIGLSEIEVWGAPT